VDAKDHQHKHTKYCKKLAQLLEDSSLQTTEIYIEQPYGEYIDPNTLEHKSGQEYGDLDVLVGLGEKYLNIEVKTNPSKEDLTHSQEQLAKAAYHLEPIEYTLTLTDSEIEKITPQDIENWNLNKNKFNKPTKHLTLKDAQKTLPQPYQPTKNQEEYEIDTDLQNNFQWETEEVQTQNLPKSWFEPRPITI